MYAFSRIGLLLALAAGPPGAQERYNATAVHDDVLQRMDNPSQDQTNLLNQYKSRARECPPGTTNPHVAEAEITVGGQVIRYATIRLGTDDEPAYCLFLTVPEERPLSLDETRDIESAIVFPVNSVRKNAMSAADKERTEFELAELIDAISRGDYTIPDGLQLPLTTTPPLVDCSRESSSTLEAPGPGEAAFIYNDFYSWRIVAYQKAFCVFVDVPVHRGLNIAEANAFILATQVGMGMSDHYRRENGIPPDSEGQKKDKRGERKHPA